MFRNISLSFILFISVQVAHTQVKSDTGLFQQIMKADSLLFDAGFNNCDIQALSGVVSDSITFYHDQSGITQGKNAFMETTRKNICGISYRPLRKLLPEYTEVYALKRNGKVYAAIQKGIHEFYARERAGDTYLTSTALFTHLWLKQDEDFVLQTVLSYDHFSPGDKTKEVPVSKNEPLQELIKKHGVPTLGLALIKDGELKSVQVAGEIYKGEQAPVDAVFNVASLTKPIITLTTLRLVENGSWSLDQPLADYYTDPDVKNDPSSELLTTRHILTHQSGFQNWRWENEDNELKFIFKPGTDTGYSGEGFEYLKHALEAKFDQPLEKLVDSLVFKPLGMHNSSLVWNESIDDEKFARWHKAGGTDTYPTEKHATASAADNLLTTIYDYGLFTSYIMRKIAEGDSLYSQMAKQANNSQEAVAMTLGWEMLPGLKDDQFALLHTGGDIGVNTLVMMLPETGEGIVIFTNSDSGNQLYFDLIEQHLSLGKEINGTAE
ncbi:class A beta-lactamase-related serine hydrolase [Robertkochia aurantiaca]|uniref:class A beta-lactamase-related serine hydrolase n=1 Tax=Robertkochia aurantiaca TaxID=2873700 RepID=UPI001CC992CE|nr:class A beta-lactamase-related serine hydrolase [Robertkochia sp. 3YJGBD-33]